MAASLTLYRAPLLPSKGTVEAADAKLRPRRDRIDRVFTRLRLLERPVARDFCAAQIAHRELVEMAAVWDGKPVDEVVAVHPIHAFYSRPKALFALGAGRSAAKRAVKRLNRGCPEEIGLKSIELDLDRLLDGLPPGGSVLGAWSSLGSRGGVKSRAAFGTDIGAELKRMRKGSSLSSLRLVYPFANVPMRVSVSTACSVAFFGRENIETRLRFMEHLMSFEK